MRHRIAALVILVLLMLVAVVATVHLVLRCIFHPDDRAREILIGLDVFGNAGMFGGSRWETISSHAGREARRETWWAMVLAFFLDMLEPGHCADANAAEQPILDLLKRHGYH